MANMISNNNSKCKNTNNAVSGGGGGGVNNLRDICNFLQQPMMNPAALPPGASPYDHIIDMIRGLDLQDDGIVMNHKIKSIETDFCTIVRDENMLCESMEYMNDIALADGDTALKFALLFSSRRFDALAMKDTKVRSAMLKILETNFLNADTYRIQDKDRLYNSITLLGEYYHRVRLADNSPITILGESLLGLLIREVSDLESIDVKLAKLILSQITLNGDIMRVRHKVELTLLLFHIRRNLIEQASLKPAVKALLLMTLDLYYSNFANLGQQLEEMYTKYLVLEDEDEGNNNLYAQQQQQQEQQQQHEFAPQEYQQPQAVYQQSQHSAQQQYQQQPPSQQQSVQYNETPHIGHFENGDGERDANATNDAFEDVQPTTKKWSEQVCEDSLLENEFSNDFNGDSCLTVSGGDNSQQERLNSSYESQREKPHASNNRRYGDARDNGQRNSRRSYQTAHSPRPLKQNYQANERKEESQRGPEYQTQSGGEERDETKPLPRWRAPRFNREPADQQHGYAQNQTRRFSVSCDDDGQSVRSEGGSIRLYSVNDRLKHSQEKIANNNSNFNYIANSNWDRQSQRDDRSERSYISNYEMGNYRRRGGRGQYNRPTYDKPPRFQKHQQNKDNNKIHSDSWRRSQNAQHGQSGNTYQDENSSYPTGGEPDSRSSSRARTLPRPAKSNWGEENANAPPAYRRSQSPSHSGHQYQRGPRPRQYNARYSSQSSLASEASSTLERRHNNQQRHRSYTRRPQQPQETHDHGGEQVPQKGPEDARDNNSELVRNAQQTTQYMNYLSSKK